MGQMFATRCKHFRAEKSTGGRFCVNVHQSLVPQQDARTALVLEVHLAGREAAWLQRTKSAPTMPICGSVNTTPIGARRRPAFTGCQARHARHFSGIIIVQFVAADGEGHELRSYPATK